MTCEKCGVQIPLRDQETVKIGQREVPYPYCVKCAEEWQKKIKDFKRGEP